MNSNKVLWDNQAILKVAMEQSAIDAGCHYTDFSRSENVIVPSREHPLARRYLVLPHICNLISYGNNVVASIDENYREVVTSYVNKYRTEQCFETPSLHVLDNEFRKDGCRVCFMAEYWLPNLEALREIPCPYQTRLLERGDFADLYTDAWSNALCEKRKELDVLGIGAYDGEKLIGLAACSADCETMWQIGVDVLPDYRRQGIATALTSTLAVEILKRGKVPFYCCAWSNIKSARNAAKSGFRPAWVEVTVKPEDLVNQMNR